LTLASE